MMKRMGSILMLLAILAVPAQAQRQGRMRGPARPDGFGARGRTPNPSADDIIRLQERLGLSEEQVESIKEAQRSDREARDALRLETREMRDQLRDEEITRQEFREGMAGRRTTEVDGMRGYRETLNGILTVEQRSQVRSLQRQANRGRGVRRGGPASGRDQARGRVDRGSRAQRGFRAQRGSRAEQGRRNMRPPRAGRPLTPGVRR